MKASWEKIEKNQGVLEIEVGAERVADALDKAFKKVVAKVNVPGFRKGKVPRQIFESKFGVESLYQDALDIILPEVYVEAIKETGIDPIDRPEVDIEQFAKGQSLKFKATVQVKPEVQLGEYKGIELAKQEAEVSEEEIAKELERLQQRHAELIVLEEGTLEKGDIAILDFEGFVDGVPFEGGKAEKYSLEIGSGSFIPGFEEQMIGMNKDEEKDVEVTFPEQYQSAELAGKPAVFKVKLHDIKRKQLPVLDDEFAKDVSEFETLEEYKQDIVNRLTDNKKKEIDNKLESEAVDKAASAAEVEIPEVMVRTEQDQMLREFSNRLRMQGMNMELYYQYSGQNEESLKDQWKDDALKRVRNQLVLDAIAKAENLEVAEEDISEELDKMAQVYKKTADELRSIFTSNGEIEAVKDELRIRKTIKFLVDNSKMTSDVA